MYSDTLKQIMEDLEDLIVDMEEDQDLINDSKSEVLSSLDEAYSALEDGKRAIPHI